MTARRLVPALLLALLACSWWRPDPEAVARAFWEAGRRGDTERAHGYVSATSRARLTSDTADDIEEITFGDTEVAGANATVRTRVRIASERGPVEVSFRTHLVHEDGTWKVELDETLAAFVGAALGASLRDVAEGVGRAVGAAVRGAVEGFAEGMRSTGDSLVARDTAH